MRHSADSSAGPFHRIRTLKTDMEQDIRQLRKKYAIMKIKCFFLFVLPILLIVIAYQVAKQLLKVKLRQLGTGAAQAGTVQEAEQTEAWQPKPAQTKTVQKADCTEASQQAPAQIDSGERKP